MPDPIVLKGTPVLHQKADPVPDDFFGTQKLDDMIKRMSESLRATEHGVAIAAPQIGIPYRLFVVRGFVLDGLERTDKDADKSADMPFINPKIIKTSRKKELMEEACLSVPGYAGHIKRAVQSTVRACDRAGVCFERGASGLLAEIFQHEIDHLDGILYVDKAEDIFEAKTVKRNTDEE